MLNPNSLGSATVRLKDKLDKEIEFMVVVEEPYCILEFPDNAISLDVAVNNHELIPDITDDLSKYMTIAPNTIYVFSADEKNTLTVYTSKETLKVGMPVKTGVYSFEEGVGLKFTFGEESNCYTANNTSFLSFLYTYLDGIGRKSSPVTQLILCNDYTEKYDAKYPHAGVKKAIINYVVVPKQYKEYN